MEYEIKPYVVYVKTDELGRITAVNSSAFLFNVEGWTEVDSGYGDKYHHAQGNYFDKPVLDERGIWRYRLVLGVPQERTREDMDADYVEHNHIPTYDERIAMLEQQNENLAQQLLAAKILLGLEE